MKQVVVLLALLLAVPAVTAEKQQIQVDSSEQTAGFGLGKYPQVSSHVILADGSHVTLWCQGMWRNCVVLKHQPYDADVDLDKSIVWIYTQHDSSWGSAFGGHSESDQGKGKEHKIKYRISGNW